MCEHELQSAVSMINRETNHIEYMLRCDECYKLIGGIWQGDPYQVNPVWPDVEAS